LNVPLPAMLAVSVAVNVTDCPVMGFALLDVSLMDVPPVL